MKLAAMLAFAESGTSLSAAKGVAWLLAMLVFAAASIAAENEVPEGQVVRLPVADDPTVSFRIWFKVGSQDDPAGKKGLAALLGSMLADASTQRLRYEEILDRLAELPKDKRIIIHCSTGVRAEMAYHKLKEKGYNAAFLNAKVEVDKDGNFKLEKL